MGEREGIDVEGAEHRGAFEASPSPQRGFRPEFGNAASGGYGRIGSKDPDRISADGSEGRKVAEAHKQHHQRDKEGGMEMKPKSKYIVETTDGYAIDRLVQRDGIRLHVYKSGFRTIADAKFCMDEAIDEAFDRMRSKRFDEKTLEQAFGIYMMDISSKKSRADRLWDKDEADEAFPAVL